MKPLALWCAALSGASFLLGCNQTSHCGSPADADVSSDGGHCDCDVTCPRPQDADQARSDCGTPDEPQSCDDLAALRRIINDRRSFRSFSNGSITREDVMDLVWAAQGVTDPDNGFRAAPSAGATYPLETYVVADRVDGLDPGVYRYDPEENSLELSGPTGTHGAELAAASVDQAWVREAAANILFAAVYERTTERYGTRGYNYVSMEAGHAAENLLLMATARGLGSVPIGAFDNAAVVDLLGLPDGQDPLYYVCVGQRE